MCCGGARARHGSVACGNLLEKWLLSRVIGAKTCASPPGNRPETCAVSTLVSAELFGWCAVNSHTGSKLSARHLNVKHILTHNSLISCLATFFFSLCYCFVISHKTVCQRTYEVFPPCSDMISLQGSLLPLWLSVRMFYLLTLASELKNITLCSS